MLGKLFIKCAAGLVFEKKKLFFFQTMFFILEKKQQLFFQDFFFFKFLFNEFILLLKVI